MDENDVRVHRLWAVALVVVLVSLLGSITGYYITDRIAHQVPGPVTINIHYAIGGTPDCQSPVFPAGGLTVTSQTTVYVTACQVEKEK